MAHDVSGLPGFSLWGHVRHAIEELQEDVAGYDRGIVYVSPDGSDGNLGRSWTLPKATIAGAQAAGGEEVLILVGQAGTIANEVIEVNESIELVDGQLIQGISPHLGFGSVLKATAGLGANPLLTNASGNLTSGGIRNLRLVGTADGNGGVGILFPGAGVADGWTLDGVFVEGFTSHGIHWSIPGGQLAGNPAYMGRVDVFDNGGDGIRLERPNNSVVHFDYVGGDDNTGSLLHLDTLNSTSLVNIGTLKSERRTTAKHDNILTVATSNGGAVRIGDFWVYSNVSGGTDGNALIKETGGTALRFAVGHAHIQAAGSNTYTYGFDDGTTQITLADFVRKPWFYYSTLGLKAPGTYTPTNVTTDRAFDADSTTTAELADVLGSLIADLQTLGVLN